MKYFSVMMAGTVLCFSLFSCATKSSQQSQADHTASPVTGVSKNARPMAPTTGENQDSTNAASAKAQQAATASPAGNSAVSTTTTGQGNKAQPGTNGGASNSGNGKDNSHVPQTH